MSEDNKTLVRRLFGEIFTTENLDAADEIMVKEYVEHAVAPCGREEPGTEVRSVSSSSIRFDPWCRGHGSRHGSRNRRRRAYPFEGERPSTPGTRDGWPNPRGSC